MFPLTCRKSNRAMAHHRILWPWYVRLEVRQETFDSSFLSEGRCLWQHWHEVLQKYWISFERTAGMDNNCCPTILSPQENMQHTYRLCECFTSTFHPRYSQKAWWLRSKESRGITKYAVVYRDRSTTTWHTALDRRMWKTTQNKILKIQSLETPVNDPFIYSFNYDTVTAFLDKQEELAGFLYWLSKNRKKENLGQICMLKVESVCWYARELIITPFVYTLQNK